MKIRSTKVDAGDFKHELLNRLRSTMAVNVLIEGYSTVQLNTQILWILGHGECQVFSNLSENRKA